MPQSKLVTPFILGSLRKHKKPSHEQSLKNFQIFNLVATPNLKPLPTLNVNQHGLDAIVVLQNVADGEGDGWSLREFKGEEAIRKK